MSAPKPGPRTKTTIVISTDLLYRLKMHALERRTDVSTLLCTLAETYLKAQPITKQKGRKS
jgi:hypothetical protein